MMRIWHWQLLPYLPDYQFRGQLRELVAIMHDWRDKGRTNHLLINKVMDYRKYDLLLYFQMYRDNYIHRYKRFIKRSICDEFYDFGVTDRAYSDNPPFESWHDDEYLKICMVNLYEKHISVGRTRINGNAWQRLLDGYKTITGKDFEL